MSEQKTEKIVAICPDCGKELTEKTAYKVKLSEKHDITCCFHCADNRETARDFPDGLPEDELDIEYREMNRELSR